MKNLFKKILLVAFAASFCLVLPSCGGKAVIENSVIGQSWNDMVHGDKAAMLVSYTDGFMSGNNTSDKDKITSATDCLKNIEKHVVEEIEKPDDSRFPEFMGKFYLLDFETDYSFWSASSSALEVPEGNTLLTFWFYDDILIVTDVQLVLGDYGAGKSAYFKLDKSAQKTVENLIETFK